MGRRATLWLLFLVPPGLAQDAPALVPETCVFAGMVRDSVSGGPIVKATVDLRSHRSAVDYATTTDTEGAFRFDAIAPGDYGLEVRAHGYRSSSAVSLKPGQFASLLRFTAGLSITGAIFALAPPGVVSGHVTDADGRPISNARVAALVYDWQSGGVQFANGAKTSERGEYRMTLFPGRFYLSAGPTAGKLPRIFSEGPGKPEMIVATQFYPNLPDSTGAAQIEVAPGEQREGIDFKLPTVGVYHVRGSVQPADWKINRALILQRAGGSRESAIGADVKNGKFDFAGVAPGSYSMRVVSPNEPISGEIPIEVTDQDLEGLVFRVVPPLTVKGSVRFDDGDAHDLSHIALLLTPTGWETRHWGPPATTQADGSFQFKDVPATEFTLQLVSGNDIYIESATYNHRLTDGIVDLRGGAAGELEIVLGTGSGQISGSVHWPDDTSGGPASAAPTDMVAIVAPAEPIRMGTRGVYRTRMFWLSIDQDGRFQFPGLPPGRYFVWAAKSQSDAWGSPDYITRMMGSAVTVDLATKGSVHVELSEVVE